MFFQSDVRLAVDMNDMETRTLFIRLFVRTFFIQFQIVHWSVKIFGIGVIFKIKTINNFLLFDLEQWGVRTRFLLRDEPLERF